MAITAASLVAQVSVSGADKAKSDLEGVGSTVSSVGGFIGNALVNGAVAAGKAIVGFGVQSVQMAGDFESAMIKIKTSAGETGTLTSGNLKVVSDGILNLATQTGTSADDLAQSMYYIESAGMRGSKGLLTLRAAAEGAKLENVDTTQVTRALLAVMQGYHMPAEQATNAMNALVSATSHGGASLNELTGAMAQVLPTASSLHIPFEQVAAAIGVMTNKQTTARQASQNLAHVLLGLEAPNGKAVDAMTNVGLSAQKVRDALVNQGLPQALQMIEDHVGKKFPKDSVEYTSALKDILGGIVGFKLAAQLTGPSLKDMKASIKEVGDAAKDSSGNIMGWAETQNTFNVKMQQAQEAVEVLEIKVGTALLPVLSSLLNRVTPLITQFTDWVVKNNVLQKSIDFVKQAVNDAIGVFNTVKGVIQGTITVIQNIVSWYNQWKPAIETTATALLVFFTPALIKAGVEATISGVKIAANFVASLFETGTAAIVNAAKVSGSFVVSLIQTGAEGWAAAGKLVTSIIPAFIQTGAQAVANAAKVTASFVASMVKAGIEAVASAAKVTASFIASMIATGAQAVITGAQIVASFVAGLVSAAAEAVVSAGIMLSTLVPALATVAVEVIAATWPFLLIAAVVAAVVVGIVLAIQHWGQITTWFQGVWSGFSSWFQSELQVIGNFFHSVWNSITSFFQSAGSTLVNIGRNAATLLFNVMIGPIGMLVIYIIQHWQQILSITRSIWASITSSVSGFVNNIVSFVSNSLGGLAGQALAWGRDMISNFISGLTSAAGGLISEAQNIASQVASILHFSKPDVGPLADADTWMPDFMDLLATGINNNLDKVRNASLNIGATVSSSINPTASSFASPTTTSGSLGGLSVVPTSVSQATTPIQVVVPSSPVYLDGRLVANGVLPHIVNSIRVSTGTRTF